MNKNLILPYFIIAFFIFVIPIGLIMSVFTQQTITYSTNFNCEEIRDCILLEYSCYDSKVDNKLFFFEWDFEREAWLDEQKDKYKEDCLGVKRNE